MSEKGPKSPNQDEGVGQDKAQETQRMGNSPAAGAGSRVAELHFPASEVENEDVHDKTNASEAVTPAGPQSEESGENLTVEGPQVEPAPPETNDLHEEPEVEAEGKVDEEHATAQNSEALADEEPFGPAEAQLEPANSIPVMAIPPAAVTPGALTASMPGNEDTTEEKDVIGEPAGQKNIEDESQPADRAESEEEAAIVEREQESIAGDQFPATGESVGQTEQAQEAAGEEPASPAEPEEPPAIDNIGEVSEEPVSAEERVERPEQAENEMPAGEPTAAENIDRVPEEPAPTEENAEQKEQVEQELPAAGAVEPTIVEHEEVVSGEETGGDEEPEVREEVVDDLAHIIESIIFASDEPLPVSTIKSVLDAAHTFGRVNPDMITSRVNALNAKYEADGTGFHIVEIANGFQYATRKEMAQWVSNLFKERSKRRLSNSALETVAIIAYKQPITKPEIESIRGVNVDYVLHNLLEKELVTVVGRAETVGRPLLYGTTQKFMKVFTLKSLDDLPKLREIEEIIKEIKSKGAEESIQLEITALGDSSSPEPPAGGDIAPEAPSENGAE